jgi:hypothetical protein
VPDIEIVNGDLDRPYVVMGMASASVTGVALWSRSRTTEEVDSKLREKALKLGANAVIHVTYERGIGEFAWKELKANGVAVIASPATRACPFCAEDVKLEASVCRFCGRDLPDAPAWAPPVLVAAPPPGRFRRWLQGGAAWPQGLTK